MLAEYRKLVSDAKRYHLDKFSSLKITTDRLDSFLFEVIQNQNESAVVDYNFVVNDALLSSCAHARNRYQMYLMERKAEQERTEKGQKRKALMEELTSAKKAKEDLEMVSKKLVNTADKKAKEAEKQKDSTAMKALLVELNATRSRSEEIQKKEIPGQEKEIKKIEERIKKIDY